MTPFPPLTLMQLLWLFVIATVTVTAAATSQSRTPSPSLSPPPVPLAPYPPTAQLRANTINAVEGFLRPPSALLDPPEPGSGGAFVARRLLDGAGGGETAGGGASALRDTPEAGTGAASPRRLAVSRPAAPPAPTPLPHLSCRASAQPPGVYPATSWCLLAHLAPHVSSLFASGRSPQTVLVPTDAAFDALLGVFPAFMEWCVPWGRGMGVSAGEVTTRAEAT